MKQFALTNEWQAIATTKCCYQYVGDGACLLSESKCKPDGYLGFMLRAHEIRNCDVKRGHKLYARLLSSTVGYVTVRYHARPWWHRFLFGEKHEID